MFPTRAANRAILPVLCRDPIMGPVVFLASGASALMTGTSVVIDGGWTAD
jgi:NAD(P)-dependent dehydrogenase (short-subunit alcohol dehydrogenase family)